MTIQKLVEVAPPPAIPFQAFEGPWGLLEAELGTELPQDYKEFVRLYGMGSFLDFIAIFVPRSSSPYARLEFQSAELHKVFSKDPEVDYPAWPFAEDFLAFGVTGFSDYLFWRMRGPPSEWTIVVWGRQAPSEVAFEEFDCGFSEFLTGLATGDVRPTEFPENLLPFEPAFAPHWMHIVAGKPPIRIPLSSAWERRGVTREARRSGWRFGRGSDWRREP